MRLNPSFKEGHLLIAILFIALLTRVMFVASVRYPFFDEVHHIPSAYNYIEKGFLGKHTWYHPNMKHIVMYYSIKFFGDNPIGWRMPWVLSGFTSVTFLYLLTHKLLGSKRVALIASFLFAIDPLHISQSRINPDETMTVLTTVISLYLALHYISEFNPIYLILTGLVLGIGVSVKWYAVFTIITIFAICSFMSVKKGENLPLIINRGIFIFLSLVVLPITVYLLSYYPWFGEGHSLKEFIWLQTDMYKCLQSMNASDFSSMTKLNASKAYLWFIIPLMKGVKESNVPQFVVVVPFICNPLVWLLTFPSIGYVIYKCMTERAISLFIIAGAFFMQYAPLLFVKRPVFIHSAMSVLPFSIIAIAYTLVQLFDSPKKAVLLKSYLLLNLIFVVLIMPLLLSYPIPEGFYNNYLRWLDMFLS